jgi:hypothetical protein
MQCVLVDVIEDSSALDHVSRFSSRSAAHTCLAAGTRYEMSRQPGPACRGIQCLLIRHTLNVNRVTSQAKMHIRPGNVCANPAAAMMRQIPRGI